MRGGEKNAIANSIAGARKRIREPEKVLWDESIDIQISPFLFWKLKPLTALRGSCEERAGTSSNYTQKVLRAVAITARGDVELPDIEFQLIYILVESVSRMGIQVLLHLNDE